MARALLKKILGTRNDRILKGYRKIVIKINALEHGVAALSDIALREKTDEFKARYAKGESLDQLLPEAFAVVREASQRTIGLRHFDVQLIGGMVLHEGRIAEMRTGEGKTLTETLPLYLNALSGKGVHLVTVNDYLAERDANWMRPVYEFLGLNVGINLSEMSHQEKQAAYLADVTYGTNNEFGFDYLRDNMVFSLDQRVQRPVHYALIDEVDSVLIDEARTPLIISGQAEESSDLYQKINPLIPQLTLQTAPEGVEDTEIPDELRGDYTVDEKNQQAFLTEQGHVHVEELLVEAGLMSEGESLYDVQHITLMHYVSASLKAHTLYQRDVHYIVRDNEIVIVDEHTGRLMAGRRWSDGLHQAVEAKESVTIQLENQTLASITFQNFFRLYEKLSGMTGTADTEAYELQKIYGLEVVVVPTNKPMVRDDAPDCIYLTSKVKYKAISEEITKRHEKGQPILIGTASIESSELLSHFLKDAGIAHEVLNAKQHEREAKIIAQAGRPGAITIATNMAGRGTDIVLGGNLDVEISELKNPSDAEIESVRKAWSGRHAAVLAAGGLHVLGTERHESRRIDNQLRGRSGRQGDAGSSQFYLSLEDNLLRVFASEAMSNFMRRVGVTEDDVIQSKMVSNSIERAQRRVEGINFDARKNLLEYDDVANDQRKLLYHQRLGLLQSSDITETLDALREEAAEEVVSQFVSPQSLEETWDISGLERHLQETFYLHLPLSTWVESQSQCDPGVIQAYVHAALCDQYADKISPHPLETVREMEKTVMLHTLDHNWKEHLAAMDRLRQGIHLRGYAQKNPAQEYKRESFDMFSQMMARITVEVIETLSKIEMHVDAESAPAEQSMPTLHYHHEDSSAYGQAPAEEADPMRSAVGDDVAPKQPFVREGGKIGRNDPCHCGSGKKYKRCHGALS